MAILVCQRLRTPQAPLWLRAQRLLLSSYRRVRIVRRRTHKQPFPQLNAARQDEVITALGYVAKSAPESAPSDDSGSRRRSVLADLKDGKITPDQALAALNEPNKRDS